MRLVRVDFKNPVYLNGISKDRIHLNYPAVKDLKAHDATVEVVLEDKYSIYVPDSNIAAKKVKD